MRVGPYAPRFVSDAHLNELSNLFHLARTALSGKPDQSPYARMLWASAAFHKANPSISASAAYKDLSAAREFGR